MGKQKPISKTSEKELQYWVDCLSKDETVNVEQIRKRIASIMYSGELE